MHDGAQTVKYTSCRSPSLINHVRTRIHVLCGGVQTYSTPVHVYIRTVALIIPHAVFLRGRTHSSSGSLAMNMIDAWPVVID